ncbi:hypothetical protein FG05_09777 [Fusarium graminearum]|nr:hypothetical protein FG05_09777 [Fusarium graminearum]
MLAFSTEYLHVPTTKYPLGKRHDNACEKLGESLPAAHLVPSGPVTHSIRLFYEVKGRVYPRTSQITVTERLMGFIFISTSNWLFWRDGFVFSGSREQLTRSKWFVLCYCRSNPHLQVVIKQATNLPTLVDI